MKRTKEEGEEKEDEEKVKKKGEGEEQVASVKAKEMGGIYSKMDGAALTGLQVYGLPWCDSKSFL